MNENEQIVKKKYEDLGYVVIHNGSPDFLIFKRDGKGNMCDIGFIEVKSRNDRLKPKQALWGCAMKSLNLNYRMQYPDECAIEPEKKYFSFIEATCPSCGKKFDSYHMTDKVLERFSNDNGFWINWNVSELLNKI